MKFMRMGARWRVGTKCPGGMFVRPSEPSGSTGTFPFSDQEAPTEPARNGDHGLKCKKSGALSRSNDGAQCRSICSANGRRRGMGVHARRTIRRERTLPTSRSGRRATQGPMKWAHFCPTVASHCWRFPDRISPFRAFSHVPTASEPFLSKVSMVARSSPIRIGLETKPSIPAARQRC